MAAHSLASAFASAKKTSEELVWDGDDDESGDDEDGVRETLVRMSLAAQQETQASHVAFAAEATGLTPRSGSSSGTSFFAEPVPAAPSPDGHLSLVLAELLETERRFKSRCEILVEYFQRPFERWVLECADASPTRQRRRSSGVDDAEGSPTLDDARTLFGNAAEVLAWSKAFVGELESCFADAVEQRADVWSTAARVGAVRRPTTAARFFENESFVGAVVFAAADRDMKAVFAAYSRNRDDSRKKHAALPAAARTFLRALELHPLARNLPLESYLMEPVQRIPRAAASPYGRATGDPARHRRYGLLLDEALRRCPDGGGDDLHAVAVLRPCRGALSRARDAVKAACGSVDASVDAAAVLSSLSVSWRLPWLAVPQRVLLHRGPLAKSTKRGGTRRVVAAVCNDLLLYGTEGKAFRLRKVIPIAAAVVVDASLVYSAASAPVPRASKQARKLLDRMGLDVRGVDLDACSFLVESPQKGVVLTAPSPRDKLDWIAAFVAAQADKLHRRSKRDVKPPPARAKPPGVPALMPRRDAAPPAAKPLAEARTAPSKVPATFTL